MEETLVSSSASVHYWKTNLPLTCYIDGGPFYAATGNGQSMLSNRVSWFFDLHGPSFTIDTACSSSLYAVHLACQSLKLGETKMALVGGTNLIYDLNYMRDMVTMTFFSPDGVCHSFDHRANGYARGEGIGGIVLKTVRQAIADGDTIRAVIRGTGLNQDGKTPGITMPSPQAQADLIRSTYASAGLSLDKTAYFEAHGTGTAIGDPYELSALGATFGKVRTSEEPIYVGSVKTNIGHLEGCAGLAGLIKTVLAVENAQIPPLAGFEKANPRLKLDEWHVALPETLIPWPQSGLRRASVNSFGYGGANAHVIVDDAEHFLRRYQWERSRQSDESDSDDGSGYFSLVPTPDSEDVEPLANEEKLFVFSSADQAGLQRVATSYLEFLEQESTSLSSPSFLSDLAYTLDARRTILDHRSFLVANSETDLIKQLRGGLLKFRRTAKNNNTFFIFSGQGAQWPTMGKELIAFPIYRKSLHKAQATLFNLGSSWSLTEELFAPDASSRVNSPEFSQPLCTALQLALVDLLESWGVLPKSVVGHSSGEIAAAYAAGHISHEDAMKVAYLRGVYSADVNRRQPDVRGGMMAVGLSPEDCAPYFAQIRPNSVVVGCINSPSSVTLSGDEDSIIQLENLLNKDGVFARRLRVETAYHSHHMKVIAEDYLNSMGSFEAPPGRTNEVTMFSSVTASQISAGEINAEYWVKNLLGTVRFAETVRALITQPVNPNSRRKVPIAYSAMIECGPAEALKGPLNQILAATDEKLLASVPYVSLLSRKQDARITAMKAAGKLWAQGIKIDLSTVNFANQPSTKETKHKALVNLPPYPWNHNKLYFHESAWGRKYRHNEKPRTDLLGLRLENQNPNEPRWHNYIRVAEQPWLSDHRVQNMILYPGAAMVTMAFEAARELVDPERDLKAVQAEKLLFKRGMVIPSGDGAVETSIHLRPYASERDSITSWSFTVFSHPEGESWQENCTGVVSLVYVADKDQADADALEWQADVDLLHGIEKRATRNLSPETFYNLYDRKMNLQYGPLHQNVTRCIAGTSEGLGTVTIPNTKASMPAEFEYPHLIHPATLDAVFHLQALGYLHSLSGEESLIPISIDSIYVSADAPTAPGTELVGYSKGDQSGSGDTVGDIVLSDDQWISPKVVVRGFLSRDMSAATPSGGADTRSKKCTNIEWIPLPTEQVEEEPKEADDEDESSPSETVQSPEVPEIPDVLILRLADAGSDTLSLMTRLADQLKELNFPVQTGLYPKSNEDFAIDATGKAVISLVEADEPVIANWDEQGFNNFRTLAFQADSMVWITRGGDAVTQKDLGFHVSTGLLRTVRVERPQIKLAHLDIDPKTNLAVPETTSLVVEALNASILNTADAVEHEFAEVDGKLMVPRLTIQESFHSELGRQNQQAPSEATLGSLNRQLKGSVTPAGKQVIWSDNPQFARDIEPEEVDIQTLSVSLERSTTSEKAINITDAAGIITAIGSSVTGLSIGDRVVVCGPHELESHVRAHQSLVRQIPKFMSTSVATGLPSALCTVEALMTGAGNLQSGESILICAMPGHVQQALVSFANHVGANVFVTSETPGNRRLLEECFDIPKEHILGSLSSEATWKTLKCLVGNEGIDVVINTVGNALEQSMATLADFGRFVVSGGHKISSVVDKQARNITLSTLDIEHMAQASKSRLVKLFSRGWERALDGYLDSFVSGKKFEVINFDKASSYLQSDDCAGGAVLTLSPSDTISVLPPASKRLELDPEATYVLSGGLGGIGRSIAEMMLSAGARNISFISRSGAASEEAKGLLGSLRERGCNAEAYACDITNSEAVAGFAKASIERGENIKGVVQCAMVLRDSMFDNMTFEQWTQSLAPKVDGTWNLHQHLPKDMEFFIMLSSMAGIIGNPGQANYSAAGTYQDALSRHRRANGLACTTVDLGIVSDVGYIAENAAEFKRLDYLQNLFISERDLHLILSAAMSGQTRDGAPVPPQLVTGVGKELLAGGSLGTAMSSDLKYINLQDASDNNNAADASEDEEVKQKLKSADTFATACKAVEDFLCTNLARALTVEKEDIDMEKPVHAYGGTLITLMFCFVYFTDYNTVDSLVAIDIRNMIFAKLKADISVFDIMSNISLTQLSAKTASKSKLVRADITAEVAQDA